MTNTYVNITINPIIQYTKEIVAIHKIIYFSLHKIYFQGHMLNL